MNIENQLPIAIIIIPLFYSLLLVVQKNKTVKYQFFTLNLICFYIAYLLLKIVIQQKVISYNIGSWDKDIGIIFEVNWLSSIFLILFSGVALINSIYCLSYKNKEDGKFYSLFLIYIAGIFGITITRDIFNMYVFLEIIAISSYFLISTGNKKHRYFATFEYLIYSSIAGSIILLGIGIMHTATGTLNIDHLLKLLIGLNIENIQLIIIGSIFIIFGCVLKAGIIPFGANWLEILYKNCNKYFIPYFAAISNKVIIVILIKILYPLLFIKELSNIMMWIGICGALFASFIALKQTDSIKILTNSGISYAALIIILLSVNNNNVFMLTVTFIAIESISKMSLLLIYNNYFYLNRVNKFVISCFIINSIILVGAPFTSSFAIKISLISNLLTFIPFIVIPIILVSFCSAIYLYNIQEKYFLLNKAGSIIREKDNFVVLSLLLSTVCNIYICFFHNDLCKIIGV